VPVYALLDDAADHCAEPVVNMESMDVSSPDSVRQLSSSHTSSESHCRCCYRRTPCCCGACGPKIPRWVCCTGCLVVWYILLCPILYFAMHVVQFPGNIEGDFEIDGATRFNFTARSSDNQKLQALTVRVPRFGSDLLCEPRIPILFFGGHAQGMSGAANDA